NGYKLKCVDDVIAVLQKNSSAATSASGGFISGTPASTTATPFPYTTLFRSNDRRAIQAALNDPKKGLNLGQVSNEQMDRIVKALGGGSTAAILSELDAIAKDGSGAKMNSFIETLQQVTNAENAAKASTPSDS